MSLKLRSFAFIPMLLVPLVFHGQAAPTPAPTGVLRGAVVDPSGAVVPKAKIKLLHRYEVVQTQSSDQGQYSIRTLAPRTYTVRVTASGFDPLTVPGVTLTPGKVKELNLPFQSPQTARA